MEIEYKAMAIVGKRGSGKTMYAVHKCKQYYDNGGVIYSNTNLYFGKERLVIKEEYSPDEIEAFKKKRLRPLTRRHVDTIPEELQGACILIDEIQAWADSYKFYTSEAINLSNLMTQMRKRKLFVIITTTHLDQAAKRIRQQMDYICYAEKVYLPEKQKLGINPDNIVSAIDITLANERPEFSFLKRVYFNGEYIKNMYETNMIIIPI